MNLSVFEIGMLVCFGASWPFALWETYKTKSVKGKSVVFSWLVFMGYVFGVVHKLVHDLNPIIYLYAFIGVLVIVDIIFWYRYKDNDILVSTETNLDRVKKVEEGLELEKI